MIQLFVLLVLFQAKHFLADFPLQSEYMLGKFKAKGWVKPLAAHAAVHGYATFAISWNFLVHGSLLAHPGFEATFYPALGLGLLDFTVHFIVDRIKASPKLLGRYKALSASEYPTATAEQKVSNVRFWHSLGADQTAHHLTHYAIIYLLVS